MCVCVVGGGGVTFIMLQVKLTHVLNTTKTRKGFRSKRSTVYFSLIEQLFIKFTFFQNFCHFFFT